MHSHCRGALLACQILIEHGYCRIGLACDAATARVALNAPIRARVEISALRA